MTDSCVTAIVLTLNEQRHLPDCLRSLTTLTSDMLVIDSGSTDATREIAGRLGATVVERTFTGYASQRNAGLEFATSQWILFIDADERLTPDLACEINTIVANDPGTYAGYWIPRKNVVCGKELRGGGWWPDYQARLIRKGHGAYNPAHEVHEIVDFDGPTGKLDHPLVHINYETWREVLHRQRAYTIRKVQSGLVPPPRRLSYLSRPLREIFRRFVKLKGYRDGATGLKLALILGLEEFRGCLLARQVEEQ